ncbi:MAG: hypothetical protein J5757_05520 [Lachnospiraceae bacterium]|nr:hypothetical protein [Lachnospiraceae bacterium]
MTEWIIAAFILGAILGLLVAFDITIKRVKTSNEAGASAGHLEDFGKMVVDHSRTNMSSSEYETDCKVTKGRLDTRFKNAVGIYKKDPDYCEWLDKHQP